MFFGDPVSAHSPDHTLLRISIMTNVSLQMSPYMRRGQEILLRGQQLCTISTDSISFFPQRGHSPQGGRTERTTMSVHTG